MYASNTRSEWWGCIKSSSTAWPSKTGTKHDFATYIKFSIKKRSKMVNKIVLKNKWNYHFQKRYTKKNLILIGKLPTVSSLTHCSISQLLKVVKHKKIILSELIRKTPSRGNTLIVFNSVMSNFAFFKTALRIYWIANFT